MNMDRCLEENKSRDLEVKLSAMHTVLMKFGIYSLIDKLSQVPEDI
jgi:hypothetical protein